ncbi:MAG: CoB--CoM heterodisulfide reductase iron-sulfur subunit A family protein [Vicinamibacteria bacterium]|jgi:heterodisulfide reductase subunit A|nr:CoB--CoM heterodisulfide reductase iron-sulfur subunit A family protein [Vicinamibacteria bacterium]
MARIGVFVCHCGTNIAATVDCAAVAAAARCMPGVVFASDYKYMCSEPGQKLIQETIAAERLDRVVVASCSPRMHEPTFRRTVAAAGVNPYRMEMANLREQCSWVHGDRAVATRKAIDLVGMLVAKVARNQALQAGRAELSKRLLVIGGGIAGIQAALDVANAGYDVTLVERTPTIGGKMAMLDKTFPTLDCSACILTPLMVDVAQHPRITLMTSSEVAKVQGFVGNFEVTIKRKARYVDHDVCNGCGTCWGKCPVKDIASEFDQGLGRRPAIYLPFPQAIPNKPVIDAEHCRSIAYRKSQAEQAAQQGLSDEAARAYKPVGADGKKLIACGICEKLCTAKAIRFDDQERLVQERFGAVIVANGYDLFMLDGSHEPDGAVSERKAYYGEYGYGRYADVITALQLERLMNASGPTRGEVVRPSDGKHPRRIVFIACVGSRDDKVGRPYCSKICCMYTAKQAIMLKEHDPSAETYVFYMDLRAGGRYYDEFTRRAQEVFGAQYLRGRVSRVYPENGRYIVQGYDGALGRPVEIEADLVVLANGVTAARGATDLMQTLGISYDGYGFINEAHVKLRPVETNTAGIYLAGCSAGPKDIPDTVAQASAAAAKVAGLFARPYIETEPTISEVKTDRCVACHLCEEVCPYSAVTFVEVKGGRMVASINPAVCKGCGLCAAGCRGRAIVLHGFNDQQLLTQVEALFKRPVPLRAASSTPEALLSK